MARALTVLLLLLLTLPAWGADTGYKGSAPIQSPVFHGPVSTGGYTPPTGAPFGIYLKSSGDNLGLYSDINPATSLLIYDKQIHGDPNTGSNCRFNGMVLSMGSQIPCHYADLFTTASFSQQQLAFFDFFNTPTAGQQAGADWVFYAATNNPITVPIRYTIKIGDTIDTVGAAVAALFNSDPTLIATMNALDDGSPLHAGMRPNASYSVTGSGLHQLVFDSGFCATNCYVVSYTSPDATLTMDGKHGAGNILDNAPFWVAARHVMGRTPVDGDQIGNWRVEANPSPTSTGNSKMMSITTLTKGGAVRGVAQAYAAGSGPTLHFTSDPTAVQVGWLAASKTSSGVIPPGSKVSAIDHGTFMVTFVMPSGTAFVPMVVGAPGIEVNDSISFVDPLNPKAQVGIGTATSTSTGHIKLHMFFGPEGVSGEDADTPGLAIPDLGQGHLNFEYVNVRKALTINGSPQFIYAHTATPAGGDALAAGACRTYTTSVPGALRGQSVVASPGGQVIHDTGKAAYWSAYIATNDVVSIDICAGSVGSTPNAENYAITVFAGSSLN